ncbi:MAG TPA: hypothetical protein VN812_06070 [Candidatus Acidoferrales bacterium]|nr:hypothetical protein [Candidatus Acidoferrales bacterium]
MTVSRLIAVGTLLAAVATRATPPPSEQPIKDPDGNTLAVAVMCNECPQPDATTGKVCQSGMLTGWLKGKPCGPCLTDLNTEPVLKYPYDLHITGKLTDAKGQPLKGEFVKLLTPFGWSVRSVTSEQGTFRLTVGATLQPRKSRKPVITDIGTQVSSPKGKMGSFAIYLLPASYKECPPPDKLPADAPRTATHGPDHKKKTQAQ